MWRRIVKNRTAVALPAILFVVAVIGGLNTPGFFSAVNIEAILRNASIVGIGAVGLSFVTVSGNFISLSLQQQAMLSAIILAGTLSNDWSLAAAIPVILGATLVVSVVQGAFVALGLNPIIATLAVGSIIYGGVQAIASGATIFFSVSDVRWLSDGKFLGVPSSVVLLIVVTIVCTVFVRRSLFGRRLTLTGENREAAELSGIPTKWITVGAFVGLGLSLTLCGVLAAAQIGAARGIMLENLTFDIPTAVFVGGVAISGGEGSPLRAATGAVFIALINNLMVLHDFSAGARQIVSGSILLVAIILVHILRGREGVA